MASRWARKINTSLDIRSPHQTITNVHIGDIRHPGGLFHSIVRGVNCTTERCANVSITNARSRTWTPICFQPLSQFWQHYKLVMVGWLVVGVLRQYPWQRRYDCRSGSLPEILQYRVWPVLRTETFNTQVHWPNSKGDIEPNHPSEINPNSDSRSRSDGRSGGLCNTG